MIRIFSTLDATKVYQFRRGSYPTKIYSMSFNLVSTLLCVSSATETVHIFKLSTNGNNNGSIGNGSNNGNSNLYNDYPQEQQETRGRSSSVG